MQRKGPFYGILEIQNVDISYSHRIIRCFSTLTLAKEALKGRSGYTVYPKPKHGEPIEPISYVQWFMVVIDSIPSGILCDHPLPLLTPFHGYLYIPTYKMEDCPYKTDDEGYVEIDF